MEADPPPLQRQNPLEADPTFLPPLETDPRVVTFRGGHCSCQYASYWNALLLPPANEVCEGYVFTGVCLSMGVSAPLHAGIHISSPREPEADTPLDRPPQADTPGQTHPPLRSAWSRSGRYASHWNAFLFEIILAKSCRSHVVWLFSGKFHCLLCTGFFSTDICRQYPAPLHTAGKHIQLVFFILSIFTSRRGSYGNVMFSQAFVCARAGGLGNIKCVMGWVTW